MTKFHKILLIGVAAAGISSASLPAFANPFADKCGPMGIYSERIEQRQTQLHDKLNLAAEQEAAWKTFTGKIKPSASQPRPDRAALSALPAPERMQKMLDMMKSREGAMAERVAAVKEFYAVLTPTQQKVFDAQFSQRGRPGMKR